jgi:hypothetical protein
MRLGEKLHAGHTPRLALKIGKRVPLLIHQREPHAARQLATQVGKPPGVDQKRAIARAPIQIGRQM